MSSQLATTASDLLLGSIATPFEMSPLQNKEDLSDEFEQMLSGLSSPEVDNQMPQIGLSLFYSTNYDPTKHPLQLSPQPLPSKQLQHFEHALKPLTL